MPRFTPARIIFCFTAIVVVYFMATFTVNAIRGHQLNEQENRLQAERPHMELETKSVAPAAAPTPAPAPAAGPAPTPPPGAP